MRRHLTVLLLVVASLLAACTGRDQASPTTGASPAAGSLPVSSATSGTRGTTRPDSTRPAQSTSAGQSAPGSGGSCAAMAASLPMDQQVGQLVMVGIPGDLSSGLRADLASLHIGSVIVMGTRSQAGTADLTGQLKSVGGAVPILVSADQEGGQVQRLDGAGFTSIPNAVQQAQMSPQQLEQAWQRWGAEMAKAGVLYDLAPVADLVPPNYVTTNKPIGQLKRNYGTTTATTSASVVAVVQGLQASGVAASAKHFPGLGRVTTNTDFGKATDTVTVADQSTLAAFRAAIGADVASVMVSTAVYQKIDASQPAAFSATIITELLRGKLGYQKVVISDDLGAAAAVVDVAPGDRALRFVAAGGDIAITVEPSLARPMVTALQQRAASDPAFAKQVTAAAGRVLALKASVGLVSCSR